MVFFAMYEHFKTVSKACIWKCRQWIYYITFMLFHDVGKPLKTWMQYNFSPHLYFIIPTTSLLHRASPFQTSITWYEWEFRDCSTPYWALQWTKRDCTSISFIMFSPPRPSFSVSAHRLSKWSSLTRCWLEVQSSLWSCQQHHHCQALCCLRHLHGTPVFVIHIAWKVMVGGLRASRLFI